MTKGSVHFVQPLIEFWMIEFLPDALNQLTAIDEDLVGLCFHVTREGSVDYFQFSPIKPLAFNLSDEPFSYNIHQNLIGLSVLPYVVKGSVSHGILGYSIGYSIVTDSSLEDGNGISAQYLSQVRQGVTVQ